jgi:phage terminase small subunit
MRNAATLSPKQERFAAAYAQHHNASLACREAGYSAHGRSASVTGTRLLADVCVLERIQALEAVSAQELGVTRQRFLYELQEAAALAREKRDPASMIAAWREIGKACGFYQPERLKVNVNVAGSLEMGRMNQLSDAELLKIIEAGQAAQPEQRDFAPAAAQP